MYSRTLRAVWVIGVLAAFGCKGSQSNAVDGGIDGPTDAATDVLSDGRPADGGVTSSAVDIGLDLGHVSSIASIESVEARALSVDDTRRWVLWDLDNSTQLVSATAPCLRTTAPPAPPSPCRQASATLRGEVAASLTRMGIQVRDANTGAITATIPVPASDWDGVVSLSDVWIWGHASDGSYIWIATKSSLRAWSATGALLVDVAGNYSAANIFAAPENLRIAKGPAGSNLIERIDVTTQARTTFTYAGDFHSWFLDGERFLTTVGVAVRVYSKTGSSLAFESLPTVEELAGVGDHVWTFATQTLRIYDIANLSSPTQTYNLSSALSRVIASAGSLALIPYGSESFEIVTLGAEVVRSAPIPVPVPYLAAYGGSANSWLIGNKSGVIFHSANLAGPPAMHRALSWGRVTSIAGTESGTAALATASGRTLILNIGAVSTVVRELSTMSSHLQLSADATHLVAGAYDGAQYHDDRALRVISVATGETTYSWNYRWNAYPKFMDFTLSPVGTVLCHVFAGMSQPVLTDLSGTVLPYYGPTEVVDVSRAHVFSPDGTKATILATSSPETTSIYTDGTLTGVVEGRNLTWMGNDEILVAKYSGTTLESVKTYDSTGTMLSLTGLSQIHGSVTYVGNGQIYMQGENDAYENAVYDVETGAKLWQGDADVRYGTVVGDYILFSRGPRVFTDRFR